MLSQTKILGIILYEDLCLLLKNCHKHDFKLIFNFGVEAKVDTLQNTPLNSIMLVVVVGGF